VLGHLPDFAADRLGAYTRWARDYGDVVPLRFGPLRGMLVTGPAATLQVVATNNHAFIRPLVLRQMQMTFGGMLIASGPDWLRHRRIAQRAFHRPRIAAYGERMVAETERLLGGWRSGDRRDLSKEMANLTLAIVARTLFDADIERDIPVLDDTLTTVQREFNAHMNSPLPLPDWVPTPGNLRLRSAVRRLDTVIAGLLAATRRAGPDADHLMALLMHARADDGDRLSARDLRDEAVTFLLAGHETTALLLSWTFALLSRHHDVRDRLEAELDDVLGGRAPTAADVGRLEVTGRVLKESLRLYPPAYAFARQATQRVEIGGVAVKKGTTVVVSPWVTHRDPRLFDQPEVFDPDRWLGDLERRLPRCAYFPFGGGPHQCIGAHFAMLEATLVLATIAQRYRLDLEPSVELVPEPLITLRPRDALWVAVRPVERPSLTAWPQPEKQAPTVVLPPGRVAGSHSSVGWTASA
jgi:cytochrome P450